MTAADRQQSSYRDEQPTTPIHSCRDRHADSTPSCKKYLKRCACLLQKECTSMCLIYPSEACLQAWPCCTNPGQRYCTVLRLLSRFMCGVLLRGTLPLRFQQLELMLLTFLKADDASQWADCVDARHSPGQALSGKDHRDPQGHSDGAPPVLAAASTAVADVSSLDAQHCTLGGQRPWMSDTPGQACQRHGPGRTPMRPRGPLGGRVSLCHR